MKLIHKYLGITLLGFISTTIVLWIVQMKSWGDSTDCEYGRMCCTGHVGRNPRYWTRSELPDSFWNRTSVIHDDKHGDQIPMIQPSARRRDTTKVVVLVLSAVDNKDRREVFRRSWTQSGLRAEGRAELVALLGSTDSQKVQKAVLQEAQQHHDILQLASKDSYRNVLEKVISGLNWLLWNYPNLEAIVKIDDDSFDEVSLWKMLELTKDHRVWNQLRDKIICRSIIAWGIVRRPAPEWGFLGPLLWNMKHAIQYEEYPEPSYPHYCSGPFYAFSTTTAGMLVNLASHTRHFWSEDIFLTGILPQRSQMHLTCLDALFR